MTEPILQAKPLATRSQGDTLALLRQREEKPAECAACNAYAGQYKRDARGSLGVSGGSDAT